MFKNADENAANRSLTLFDRVAAQDKDAVTECIRVHGDWIWAVALKNSDSEEAAEELTMTIFRDIWKFAHRLAPSGLSEKLFIALIARRRVRGKPIRDKAEPAMDNIFFKLYKNRAKSDRA